MMLLELHLKEHKGTYMHAIKKREHDKNQQHKTQDVDNKVRPVSTMSSGLGVKMV